MKLISFPSNLSSLDFHEVSVPFELNRKEWTNLHILEIHKHGALLK